MKLPCYLVRDLLPLYKDEVCEPETAADVKEHLDDCPDCRHLWETMQDTAPLEGDVAQAREQEQAAALRRVKHLQQRNRLLTVVVAAILTLGAVYLGLRLVHDYANNTYLDYDANAILKVEYKEHAEESTYLPGGEGLYITLDPTQYNTLQWTTFLDTEKGKVVVFTLGNSLWNQWMKTQWYGLAEGLPYTSELCTDRTYTSQTMDALVAAYYLPYSEFKTWVEQEKQELPEDAVLVWLRDAQ